MEIKSTTWQVRPEPRRRSLLLRHLRQMDGYLDLLLEDLGDTVDSVSAVLLYPEQPAAEIASYLEAIALARGITIVFYDDMDWRPT